MENKQIVLIYIYIYIIYKIRVQNVEVGTKIDVRDPSYIWKVAIVKRIKVASETRSHCFVVHYEVNYLFIKII